LCVRLPARYSLFVGNKWRKRQFGLPKDNLRVFLPHRTQAVQKLNVEYRKRRRMGHILDDNAFMITSTLQFVNKHNKCNRITNQPTFTNWT
jgi:hypothetical protein